MNMFSSVRKLTSCVHPTFGGRVGLTQIAILLLKCSYRIEFGGVWLGLGVFKYYFMYFTVNLLYAVLVFSPERYVHSLFHLFEDGVCVYK